MLAVIPDSFSWQQAQSILAEAYEKCIFVRPIFVEIMGSLQAGAYLSYCHFWAGKGHNSEWTYKTCQDFKDEIFLSRSQQDKVRAELKQKDWWQEKTMKVGSTPKFHFKIDKEKLNKEVILHILNKRETVAQMDVSETSKTDLLTVSKSRTESLTQSIPITNLNSLTGEPEKSAYAERLKSFSNAEPAYPSLADKQTALLVVDPNPVDGEKDSAAPRSMIINTPQLKTHKPEPWGNGYDRQQGNRDRAQSGTWFKSGLANKRWKDKADFDRFVAYVETYAENRRKDPKLNPDGTKYGKDYRTAILSRTAATQDENDSILACWKCWNLEPVAPNYIQSKPEETVLVDDPAVLAAFQEKFAKLKADNLAKKAAAAAEKVRKDEIIRGLHES